MSYSELGDLKTFIEILADENALVDWAYSADPKKPEMLRDFLSTIWNLREPLLAWAAMRMVIENGCAVGTAISAEQGRADIGVQEREAAQRAQ